MFKPLEGKTLLVTGATGFIGSHLVERLRRVPGSRLILLSRHPSNLSAERIAQVTCDCQKLTSAVWQESGVSEIDYVFHLAAEIPKISTQDSSTVYHSNVKGTVALLESLPSVPEKFLLASTLDVYAHIGHGQVLSEESPLRPHGHYSASKAQCETLVAETAVAQGFPYVAMRYGHIYGPGEQAYRKLIPETIRRLLSGKPPVVHGDGSAERDYLFVGDAVEATIRAACVDPVPAGPLNIVRGESCTIRDVVETLVQITAFAGSVQYLTDRPTGHSLRFDNSKMRKSLGEWPLVPLVEGLRREVADAQTQRE